MRWIVARPRPAAAAVAFVMVLVLASHGINMLNYPYLDADEGTYVGQGWAVFHQWRLAPYTYFYDHAPLGWIQLGLWDVAAGTVQHGYGLASGRFFMLALQLGSALLVYGIARRVSGRVWVALLAVTVFSLSTYGIYYHRRILLDNIAAFWILASLFLLVDRLSLRRVWLSALAMGIAVLSKEIAVALIPAYAVLVGRQAPRDNRIFAVGGWLTVSAMTVSVYPLMALLKDEFFAAADSLRGAARHVSLLCSLEWQSQRDQDGGLLDGSSAFWSEATAWAHAEPLLVLGGTAAAFVAVTALRRRPVVSALGWTVLTLWVFIGRGGLVLPFYLVPLLPLLALVLALVIGAGAEKVRTGAPRAIAGGLTGAVCTLAVLVCGGALALGYARSERGLFTRDQVAGHVTAVQWLQQHVPPGSRVVVDMSMWQDLQHPAGGAVSFPHAHFYWKVGRDPDVRDEIFRGDWRTVDWIVATPQLISDTHKNRFAIVTPAYEHSASVKVFDSGGWPIDIRRVDPRLRGPRIGPVATGKDVAGCMPSET